MRLLVGCVAAIVLVSSAIAAADEKKLASIAPEKPRAAVDHSDLDALLERYVDARGGVDYKEWKAKDVPALDAYLRRMANVKGEPALPRDERLALWINAYNAITIKTILERYPVASIKDVPGAWTNARWTVAGRRVSLDDIEHGTLRPMKEPRIHFAVVCASKGCPKLRRGAFSAADLDEQLEEQVKRTFADPTRLRVDARNKKVHAIKVFDWFGEDFGGTEAQRLTWIARKVADPEERRTCLDKDATLVFVDWDWSLNDR